MEGDFNIFFFNFNEKYAHLFTQFRSQSSQRSDAWWQLFLSTKNETILLDYSKQ
jgi:hypothetical protein